MGRSPAAQSPAGSLPVALAHASTSGHNHSAMFRRSTTGAGKSGGTVALGANRTSAVT